MERLQIIKESKIPFIEKLPKNSQYYKHYMTSMHYEKIRLIGEQLVADQTKMMHSVQERVKV